MVCVQDHANFFVLPFGWRRLTVDGSHVMQVVVAAFSSHYVRDWLAAVPPCEALVIVDVAVEEKIGGAFGSGERFVDDGLDVGARAVELVG